MLFSKTQVLFLALVGDSQARVTPASGDAKPFSGIHGQLYSCTYTCKLKINVFNVGASELNSHMCVIIPIAATESCTGRNADSPSRCDYSCSCMLPHLADGSMHLNGCSASFVGKALLRPFSMNVTKLAKEKRRGNRFGQPEDSTDFRESRSVASLTRLAPTTILLETCSQSGQNTVGAL